MNFRLAAGPTMAAMAVFLLCGQNVWAKTPEEVRAACRAEGRPCVGLVLSGGGARGFSHVGVLKVLEELNVKIDVVTGTSMGSMVGGAYAAGYSADEVGKIVLGVDWDKMLALRGDRRQIPWLQKLDDYSGLTTGGLKIDRDGHVRLPEEVFPSQELDIFLSKHVGAVNHIQDLSNLAIPFAAPATDLVNGMRVVMQKNCTLREAMRASMSVPAAFAPVEYQGMLLVDGGLVDNLPVELARELGADIVIAVNAGTPLAKREEITNFLDVSAQMVNLLTEQSVRRSMEQLTERDILITPDLTNFTSADLKKSPAIIDAGYEAAIKVKDRLAKLSSDPVRYAAWNKEHLAGMPRRDSEETMVRLAEVRVEGLTTVNPEAVVERADLPLDREVTNEEVADSARRIWASGDFTQVTYSFEPGPDGTSVLVLKPQELKPGYSSIRFGGAVESDFRDHSDFNLILSHTWGWMNSWGGQWRNQVQLGETKGFSSEFVQPLGPGSPWFVMPRLSFEKTSYDVYQDGKARHRWSNEEYRAQVRLGRELWDLGVIAGGVGWVNRDTTRVIGSAPEGGSRSSGVAMADLYLDTLDRVAFPTKGWNLSASWELSEDDASGDAGGHNSYEVSFKMPVSFGRWTATGTIEAGRSTRHGEYQLGGAGRLSGSPDGRWSGSDKQFGSIGLARNMSDQFDIGMPVWFGGSLEAGRAWNRSESSEYDSSYDDWKKAMSLYVGLDTYVGPVYLLWGKTFGEDSGLYFRWGYMR